MVLNYCLLAKQPAVGMQDAIALVEGGTLLMLRVVGGTAC